MPTRVQDGRIVVAVAEPTEQRIQALREVIGEDTVMVVVPRAALDAALSSELLTSRTPASEREARRAAATAAAETEAEGATRARACASSSSRSTPSSSCRLPPTENTRRRPPPPPPPLPPLVSHAELPAFLADPLGTPDPGSPAELEELRLRVRQLEAELEQRNAVAFEVQRHLQAALRRLYS